MKERARRGGEGAEKRRRNSGIFSSPPPFPFLFFSFFLFFFFLQGSHGGKTKTKVTLRLKYTVSTSSYWSEFPRSAGVAEWGVEYENMEGDTRLVFFVSNGT